MFNILGWLTFELLFHALFNRKLFENDPHIKDFIIALQAFPEMSHFSVLWLDEKPIAFNHGYIEGEELCLAGYTSYDPAESRHSPGKLHLIELAKAGEAEGITRIDLTPGKDTYKSRFSNETRDVKKVIFYFNRPAKYWGDAKLALKETTFRLFSKAGIEDHEVKFWKTELGAHLRRVLNSGFKEWGELLKNFVQRKCVYDVFQVKEMKGKATGGKLDDSYAINKNDFSDLIQYEETRGYISRKSLFQKALARFSRGDTLYTLLKDGKLVHVAWVRDGKYELTLPGTKYAHQFPEASRVIYGFSGFGDELSPITMDAFYERILSDYSAIGILDMYICFERGQGASQGYMETRRFALRFSHTNIQRLHFIHQDYHQEYLEKKVLVQA